MRRWLFLVFFVAICKLGKTQNTIGIPNIVNYTKMAYKAGNQNLCITQDASGIMYFANNDGLLSFDGTFWRIYPLPNKTIARSVAIGEDKRIYTGGQGEIGYFSPDKSGELVYTSLNKLLTPKDNDFADVWNIFFFDHHVFFRSNKKILEYYDNRIVTYNGTNWSFLSGVSGELLAYEYEKGLLSYKNGSWQKRAGTGEELIHNVLLKAALPFGKDSVLLFSLAHGAFLLHHDTLSPFITAGISSIASKNITWACYLSPGIIALTTNLGGCNIIDKKGNFIQRFTKLEGIQNINALSAFLDKDRNLWLGLDNGIDLVTYNNAIKNIFPDQENRNSGYTSALHDQQLYLGVSTGVYKTGLNNTGNDISYTTGIFEFVQNSEGQVWNLADVNGRLLMGHNKGGYRVENDKAIPLDTRTGYWGFHALPNNATPPVVIAGTYSGINFYTFKNNVVADTASLQFESARFIGIGKDIIWVAHPYKGIYRVTFDKNGKPSSALYKDTKGILSSNHNKIFKLKDRIVLTTDKGVFEYDEKEKDFVRSDLFEKLGGTAPISYIKEDGAGNIWFCRDRKVGILDRSSGTSRIIFIPEIDSRITANGFENINIIDSNNVIIAAEKGFFHINYALYKKSRQPLHVLIRKVQSPLRNDMLIFGGHDSLQQAPSIAYKYNALHFECSSVLYGQEQNTEYSYYLEGFDRSWSSWSAKREKDYTNLPAGRYIFKVKCRNNFDNESPVTGFSFTILPPWYQTWWAYTLYGIIFSGLIYFFYKRQQRKYKRQQQLKLQEQRRKYDEEQRELQLQHQLEIQENEKQIIQLKNEKLESEVRHKNSELASSAMNLVRKKEILSKLKEDLVNYKGTTEADRSAKEFQKIIRVIDKELDHNEEWEQFAVHFDSVHTNYLKKLKAGFPALTVSDLKLAAYLRLNLSSKEIAQLMNISIRGVETSRYRLRKKMGLDNETNLFDFLIKITEPGN
ncbi:MAG TPA: triple tyrosine motif-containing protein [Chitinophagaceae bacterium]|jgi:DNA-binding CsgD family transcriptional regulator|nr:triple tyrosine motif-containing protein [Chitinophagaceae bacterium]